ncbi:MULTISPECIES: hypothetical protein [unclassified Cupriavidus]|uniref:hypothetical protein n=1 Tax=unclassified Cupriavidus TaxID=2640874 RepID=UPI00313DF692
MRRTARRLAQADLSRAQFSRLRWPSAAYATRWLSAAHAVRRTARRLAQTDLSRAQFSRQRWPSADNVTRGIARTSAPAAGKGAA